MPELVSVAEAQSYLGLASTESTALIARLLGAAEAKMARMCGCYDEGSNHWLSASRVEYIDGNSGNRVVLKWAPITAVSSVQRIDSSGTGSEVELTRVTVDGYALSGAFTASTGILAFRSSGPTPVGWENGELELTRWGAPSANFGGGFRRLRVAYTGGYVTVPDDLAVAALETTAVLYRAKDRDRALQSESLGDWSWSRAAEDEVQARISSMIQPFVRYT
jgi:hypothetical protein